MKRERKRVETGWRCRIRQTNYTVLSVKYFWYKKPIYCRLCLASWGTFLLQIFIPARVREGRRCCKKKLSLKFLKPPSSLSTPMLVSTGHSNASHAGWKEEGGEEIEPYATPKGD